MVAKDAGEKMQVYEMRKAVDEGTVKHAEDELRKS